MARIALDVLYEDNHLLVVNKPAGIPTQGAETEGTSLLAVAKAYLKEKYRKPGNVYLGTVSRLDAAVSGAVVFARTSKAAARLAEQFRNRKVRKVYWAIVAGNPAATATCDDWLAKDDARHCMRVVEARSAGAVPARLAYRRLKRVGRGWLLEVTLETGRKHQIRAQLGARSLPILGDRKYGSREAFPRGIALHSRLLELTHPTRGEPMTFLADPPAAWHRTGYGA
ncbi:MAG TPA: RluA family pseudouridine synthase [Pirellulales bacterium]|nr:RluA family pseudouridine synthase [Pirellulales bacterium]